MVHYQATDRVARITLDRPDKHNALRTSDVAALVAALKRMDQDDSVDVGILSGHGPSFCSGGDVKETLGASLGTRGALHYHETEVGVILYPINWKPLIGAVHGYVFGHGMQIALMCDQLLCAERTTFQYTETRYGIVNPALYSLLVERAGAGFATDVALTGRRFGATEAKDAKLVREIAPKDVLTSATALAKAFVSQPRAATRATVRLRRTLLAANITQVRGVLGSFIWEDSEDSAARLTSGAAGSAE
jgi:methylglutaconyl-CoA hydratase